MTKTIDELDKWIGERIQGGFGPTDMALLKEEIEKLKEGDIYLEVGVDEGRSFTTAAHYAPEGVWVVGVDYIDPPARNKYMNPPTGEGGWNPTGTGLISIGAPHIYIHGDSQMVAKLWSKPISLLFIDGDHSYEGVKKDTESWLPHMKKGGTILYHDIDYVNGVPVHLDDFYGKGKWENMHEKIGRVRV